MNQLVLDQEQFSIVSASRDEIAVCDPSGNLIGTLRILSEAEAAIVAEAKRRLAEPGPRYTTEQVMAHLRSLESR